MRHDVDYERNFMEFRNDPYSPDSEETDRQMVVPCCAPCSCMNSLPAAFWAKQLGPLGHKETDHALVLSGCCAAVETRKTPTNSAPPNRSSITKDACALQVPKMGGRRCIEFIEGCSSLKFATPFNH